MVSIGKLAGGQGDYYLEQAKGRVDRVSSVSSGVEDYYFDGSDPDGVWVGSGAAAVGVNGNVRAAEFRRLLDGCHPATGEPLGRLAAKRVPGFDLTFSAPKSVSVLYGVGDPALRAVIRHSHATAVGDALGYLEREAAFARRGPGGIVSVRGRGFVGAAFRHRASRAGDPQLHTHVVIANLVQAEDGRWSALDGRRIYAHAKTAGYLYEARLRAELTRELGLDWTPVRNGIADVVGVPANVLRAFSRRRAQIEAELERTGQSGPRAAQTATLQTRRRKEHKATADRLDREWSERAAALGFTRDIIRSLTGRRLVRECYVEALFEELADEHGLTAKRSTFTRRDVIQALCERLPDGAEVAVVERLADRFLASPEAVVLAIGERAAARDALLQRDDGRLVRALPDERRYTTAELLRIETYLLTRARQGRDADAGIARAVALERAVADRPTLSDEQLEMVRRLTRDGDRVAIVVGPAGTGKTFALDAAREAWELSGTPVVGTAVAWRAARALEEGAGLPGTSVAALLARLETSMLPRGTVLVVDEAGMIGTRQMVRLHEAVRRAQGKLVLVGDDRQLPEIEAGGAFRALRTRLPAIELRENRRQVAAWERDALTSLRDGDGHAALERYTAHGRVRTGDGDAVREQLVQDWWRAGGPDGSVVLAYRRDDVADLNRRARQLLAAAGGLAGPELELGARRFAAGDRVLLRSSDRRLEVANGDRGTVTAVDPKRHTLTVRLRERDVVLPRSYLEQGRSLQHGYAMTGHAAQGLTVDRAYVLATEDAGREWLYMALSRGRHDNRLYGAAPALHERAEFAPTEKPRDAATVLELAVEHSRAQRMAIDSRERRQSRDRGLEL
jgi:conjugative relaxase-like TrwC/TraI family protein